MKTRFLTILLLGAVASVAQAGTITPASIVFGPATLGPGGDTSVAVYASGLPSNTIVGAYDVNVTFANTLSLDPSNSIVYNDAAFENLTAAPGMTPIDGITSRSATSIEANSSSLLTSINEFPTQNNGKNNSNEVLLFTLDFSAVTAGMLDNISSLLGNACNTGSTVTTQLDDFNGNIIAACKVSNVPEPKPFLLYVLGLGLIVAARLVGGRRSRQPTAA